MSYPVKQWLTTLLIGPLFPLLFNYSTEGVLFYIHAYAFFLPIGFLFSLPFFMIYFLVFSILKNTISPLVLKIILNGIAIGCVYISFVILNAKMFSNSMASSFTTLYISAYSFAIIISSLIYKLKKNPYA